MNKTTLHSLEPAGRIKRITAALIIDVDGLDESHLLQMQGMTSGYAARIVDLT